MKLRMLMSAALACLLVAAFGCGEGDGGDRDGPINYHFDSSQILGTSHELNLRIDTNVRLDFFDLPLAYDHEVNLKLDVDFIVGEGGGASAIYEVKEASIAPVVNHPDGSPGPPMPIVNQIYQELVGKVFTARIDENGQAGEWEGIDEMFAAMEKKAQDLSGDQQGAADTFLDPGIAKQWELTLSGLYAPKAPSDMYVGDAWKGKREASPGVMAELTYSLASVDGALARVDFDGTLSAEIDVQTDIPGVDQEATYEEATGTLNGHYIVDTATGLAVRYESGMVLNAEFETIEDDDIGLPGIALKVLDSTSAQLTPK